MGRRVWRTLLLLTVLLLLTSTLVSADVEPEQDGGAIQAGENVEEKPVNVGGTVSSSVPGDLSAADSSQQATVVVSDPMMASATGHGHGKKHKSKSHKSGNKSVKGKKGKKSHEAKKGHKSSKKGHFKKGEKKKYHDKHGKKHKAEDHKKKYYGSVKKAKKGKKGFKHGSKGHHKKGHKDKGFKNVYHKEEYQHKKKFYDDKDNKKYHDKHEKGHKAFKGKKGKEYKGGKSKISMNDSSEVDAEEPITKVLDSQILNLKEAVLDLRRRLKSPTSIRDAKVGISSKGKKQTKAVISEKNTDVELEGKSYISHEKTDKKFSDVDKKGKRNVAPADMEKFGKKVSSVTSESKSGEKTVPLKAPVKKFTKREVIDDKTIASSIKRKRKNSKSLSEFPKTSANKTIERETGKRRAVAKRAGIKRKSNIKQERIRRTDTIRTDSNSERSLKLKKTKSSSRVNATKKVSKLDATKPDLSNVSSSKDLNGTSELPTEDSVQLKNDTDYAEPKNKNEVTKKKDGHGEKLRKSDEVDEKNGGPTLRKVGKTEKAMQVSEETKSKVDSKAKSVPLIKPEIKKRSGVEGFKSKRMSLKEHKRRIEKHFESIRSKIDSKKKTTARKEYNAKSVKHSKQLISKPTKTPTSKKAKPSVKLIAKSPAAFSTKNNLKKRGKEYSQRKRPERYNESEEKNGFLKNNTSRRRRDSSKKDTQKKINVAPSIRINIDNPKFDSAREMLGGKYKDEHGKKGKDKKGVYHDHKSDHKKKYDKKKFFDKKSSHGRSTVAPSLQLNCICHFTALP